MKKHLMALALVAFVAPIAAYATESNGIGYTYAQLDYVNVSQSGHGGVADGAALSGSYGFADNFHVFGSYTALDYNRYAEYSFGQSYSVHPKAKPWSLGFGYAASLGSRADWVTQLSYTHDKYSTHACFNDTCWRDNESRNVWAVNTGVQGRVTDNLTANAYVGYSHGPSVSGNVFGQFGLIYNFTKTWALEGGARLNNDSTQTYNVGVRAYF
jgi:hypothetical protein